MNDPARDLLQRIGRGDAAARTSLFELLYDELRVLARQIMSDERVDHTLQPTALVHEAYAKMLAGSDVPGQESQFKAIAARVMRQVLVDHARARQAQKRGGDWASISLSHIDPARAQETVDLLALNDALGVLKAYEPVLERIVELRYFAGLGLKATAAELKIPEWEVKRKWSVARMLLSKELRPDL